MQRVIVHLLENNRKIDKKVIIEILEGVIFQMKRHLMVSGKESKAIRAVKLWWLLNYFTIHQMDSLYNVSFDHP